MSYTGTVRCGYCYTRGHNRRSCPELKKYNKANPESFSAKKEKQRKASASPRVCSYCQSEGHNKRTCEKLTNDRYTTKKKNCAWRKKFFARAKEIGFAPGALVEYNFNDRSEKYNNAWHVEQATESVKRNGALAMVIGFNAHELNHTLDDSTKDWNYRSSHVNIRFPNGTNSTICLPMEFASLAPNAADPSHCVAWKIACTSDADAEKCFNDQFKIGQANVDRMLGL